MFRAILLLAGVTLYLVATYLGHQAATAGVQGVQNLYTSALAQSTEISGSNR